MDIKIIDKDGELYRLQGEFPIVDYHREAGQVTLLPGVITRVKASEYLKLQPSVIPCDEEGNAVERSIPLPTEVPTEAPTEAPTPAPTSAPARPLGLRK